MGLPRRQFPRPTKVCEICKQYFDKPLNVGKSHWKRRRYCSKKCQYESRKGVQNEKSPLWKDKVITYSVHAWLYKNYGKANKCEFCKTINSKRYEWAKKTECLYERKRENFIMLCKKCHVHYDNVLKYLELGRGKNRDYYKNKKGGDLYGS